MLMTKDVLVQSCRDNGGYRQPHLNDQLFLQCRGFCEITGLEEYVELKALWLDQNAIQAIEGLDALQKLGSLFLHSNAIRTISGLEQLRNLRTINLSHNYISKISGLQNCTLLETLQISHNRIERLEDLQALADLPELGCVDVSHNRIDERPEAAGDDYITKFFGQFPALTVLYLHGQELPRKFKNYRKTTVVGLPQLTYLDERPIFPQERRTAEAWAAAGTDGEKAEMEKIRQEKRDELTACLRYQEQLKQRNPGLKERLEKEYQERMEAEKAWRAQLRMETQAKLTEVDHAEYEARAHVEEHEDDERDQLQAVESHSRRDVEAVEAERRKAEEAERARLEREAEAERELAAKEAALAEERDRARTKRQAKFDEMRFWVKKFAQEDAEDDEKMERELEAMLDALQPQHLQHNRHVPSDEGPSSAVGGSTAGDFSVTDPGSLADSCSASTAGSVDGAPSKAKKSAKRAARWAASAARFERFYSVEARRRTAAPAAEAAAAPPPPRRRHMDAAAVDSEGEEAATP